MAAKRPPSLDRIDVKDSPPPCSATDAPPSRSWRRRSGCRRGRRSSACGGLKPRASLWGYHAVVELGRVARPVNVFAEINLEKQANRGRFEKRLAAIDAVVECWEVSGTVDYIARFVCADLAEYEELTSALLDDDRLGAARIVSHVALRPIRRFTGYPEKLLGRNPAKR